MKSMLKAMVATVGFSANLLLWQQSRGYFTAAEVQNNPLLHMWSLGVEEQFYLFFPLGLLACHALAAWRGLDWLRLLRWSVLLLAVVNLVGAGVVNERNTVAAFFHAPLRAWEFLVGAWLALQPRPARLAPWAGEALAGLGLAVLAACCVLYSPHMRFPGWAALPPVLAAAALLYAGQGRSMAGQLLSMRLPVGLGLMSYSLYLWHWPVLVLANHYQGMVLQAHWLLLASLVLSVLTWRFVEQPWRRPRGLRPRHGGTWALASVVVLVSLCVAGLVRGGFEQRVAPAVLALDRERNPELAFVQCRKRPMAQACVLGDASVRPDTLLWGDSHLLAWAPALDRSLARVHRSAVMSTLVACAPLINVRNTDKQRCFADNEDVWNHLRGHPEIRTVILSGFWSNYFRTTSPSESVTSRGEVLVGLEAARYALHTTVTQLLASGRKVIVIGQPPMHPFDVPQAMAHKAWRDRPLPVLTLADHEERMRLFTQAIEPFSREARFQFIDPAPWYCRPDCVMARGDKPLYRDDHHLNDAGVVWAEPLLARALGLEQPPAATPQPAM